MPTRFQTIHPANWPYLGPAFQALSVDLAAIESRVSEQSSDIITAGPYTLDPLRTPTGKVVLVPAGTTVLTHTGNRWTGAPVGSAPSIQTQQLSGTVILGNLTTGTWAYATGGLFGTSIQINPTATAGDIAQVTCACPAQQKEILVSVVMTVPEPSADCRVLQLARTSAGEMGVLIKPGSGAGKVNVIFDDSKTSGSWNYVSPDVPAGKRIRVAVGAKIGTGTDGAQRASAWIVNDDGSETQIGTTYEVTGASTPANDVYTTLALGKLTNNAGLAGKPIRIESVRFASGTGAYAAGPLRDERLYPAAV